MIDTRFGEQRTAREVPWTKQNAGERLAHAWDHLDAAAPGGITGHGERDMLRTQEEFLEWKANFEARMDIHMAIRRHFSPRREKEDELIADAVER